MNHVAVDIGSRQSQYCERTADGEVVRSGRLKNAALKEFFDALEPSEVVLESCSEAFTLAEWAMQGEHKVTVVPSTLAPALGVGARGVKTDKRDAENLSLASCRMAQLPAVHVPSSFARELRRQLTSRALLVAMRTMAVNNVRGYLRQHVVTLKKGASSSLPKRARAELLAREEGVSGHLEQVLATTEWLTKQIQEADRQLSLVVEKDAACVRMMTVPGVGPVTAAALRAVVDDVSRFAHAHLLEAYLGLTPGESSSGERTQRLGISKAGSAIVRASLVQAAWSAWRTAPNEPMVKWAKALAERRGRRIAIVGFARKLAGILYALWRDGTEYSSTHA